MQTRSLILRLAIAMICLLSNLSLNAQGSGTPIGDFLLSSTVVGIGDPVTVSNPNYNTAGAYTYQWRLITVREDANETPDLTTIIPDTIYSTDSSLTFSFPYSGSYTITLITHLSGSLYSTVSKSIQAEPSALCTAASEACNFVKNGSFETYTSNTSPSCPLVNAYSQLGSYCCDWSSFGPDGGCSGNSPDYFNSINSCATCGTTVTFAGNFSSAHPSCSGWTTSTFVSTPINFMGNESPKLCGTAYGGLICYQSGTNYREYAQGRLKSPLVAGQTYTVRFFVSLAEHSSYSLNEIGIKFLQYTQVGNQVWPSASNTNMKYNCIGTSSGEIIYDNGSPVNPDVSSFSQLTNKTGWTQISGTFTAVGGENFFIIGNFSNNAGCNPQVSAGGCTPYAYYYIDRVIVSNSNPNVEIIGSDNFCCSNLTYNLNPGGNQCADWTTSPSIPFTDNGSSITLNPVSLNQDVYVIVEGITSGGCYFTDSILVKECCSGFEPAVVATGINNLIVPACAGTYAFSTLQNTGNWPAFPVNPGLPYFLSGKNIYVYQNVLIDRNTTMIGCNVYVYSGKRIDLAPGITLDARNTNFVQMCDEMWDGVYVNGNTSMILTDNCQFEQALNAIVSDMGGGFRLQGSRFYSNNIGILVNKYLFGTIVHSVDGCTFDTPSPLLFPHTNNQHGLTGISAGSLIQLQIGGPALGQNLFTNLEYGIMINDIQTTNVYNNQFRYITHHPNNPACISCACGQGTAICNKTNPTMAIHVLNVGNTPVASGNNFYSCTSGLFSSGPLNVGFRNNILDYIFLGAYVNANSNRTITVNNNSFTHFNTGVHLYTIPFSVVTIDNNDFNTGVGLGPLVSNTAISINNPTPYKFVATISNNNILRVRNGIYLRNGIGGITNGTNYLIKVIDNFIYFQQLGGQVTSATHYAIRLENINKVNVSHNTITKPGFAPDATSVGFLRGIGVNLAPDCIIYDNSITKMAEGTWALGSCLSTQFICNNFTDCWYGDAFAGPAAIGNQLLTNDPTGNQWNTTGAFSLHGAIIPAIHWWYNGAGAYIPTSDLVPFSTLSPSTFDAEFTVNPDKCGTYPYFVPPVDDREYKLGAIVRNENIYTDYPDEFKLFETRFAFTELCNRDSLLNLGEPDDTTYQRFYAQNSAGNIGGFYRVDTLLAGGWPDSAEVINNTINPNNYWESNLKRVNEIYINYLRTDSVFTPQDSAELVSFAYLHVISGGPGVMNARSLMNLDVEDLDGNQTRATTFPQQDPIVNTVNSFAFTVYPNPGDGNFTLSYKLPDNTEATFMVTDAQGRIVYKQMLTQTTTTNVSIQAAEGIYLYRVITTSGNILTSGKLSIAK